MQFFINGMESSLSDFSSDDLVRAVINSLFCWARADDDDPLPGESKFGWWGDTFLERDEHFGSKLWLLTRASLTDDVLGKAEEYASEALQWIVQDGIATSIEAKAERDDSGRLNLEISILRPKDKEIRARFLDIWEGVK